MSGLEQVQQSEHAQIVAQAVRWTAVADTAVAAYAALGEFDFNQVLEAAQEAGRMMEQGFQRIEADYQVHGVTLKRVPYLLDPETGKRYLSPEVAATLFAAAEQIGVLVEQIMGYQVSEPGDLIDRGRNEGAVQAAHLFRQMVGGTLTATHFGDPTMQHTALAVQELRAAAAAVMEAANAVPGRLRDDSGYTTYLPSNLLCRLERALTLSPAPEVAQ